MGSLNIFEIKVAMTRPMIKRCALRCMLLSSFLIRDPKTKEVSFVTFSERRMHSSIEVDKSASKKAKRSNLLFLSALFIPSLTAAAFPSFFSWFITLIFLGNLIRKSSKIESVLSEDPSFTK